MMWRSLQDHGDKASSKSTETNLVDDSGISDLNWQAAGWGDLGAGGTNSHWGGCNWSGCWRRGNVAAAGWWRRNIAAGRADGVGCGRHNWQSHCGWSGDNNSGRTRDDGGGSWAV